MSKYYDLLPASESFNILYLTLYRRKKTIEEKQRMDYEQQWKKMTF
jgi:hypothetical protein